MGGPRGMFRGVLRGVLRGPGAALLLGSTCLPLTELCCPDDSWCFSLFPPRPRRWLVPPPAAG